MSSGVKCSKCNAVLNIGDKFCLQCGAPVAALPPRKPIPKLYVLAGAVLCVVLLLYIFFRAYFFQLISLCSTALLIFTVLIMVITFRKAKSVSAVSLSISMLVSVACLMIYSRLIGGDIGMFSSALSLISGLLIGVGWSLTSRLVAAGSVVKRRGGVGYLMVWGIIFAINQILALASGRPPRIALVLLFMSAGLMVGHNMSLLIRSEHLKARVNSSDE